MKKIVLIDGNSILNRAFYGILSSKMLTSQDGKPTNAIFGFLSILFRVLDDIKPEYLMVAFDLKAPTARHKMYEGYKANRKAMPDELAMQMPVLKDILRLMNIAIIEKEGYEADDILGTIAKKAERKKLDVTIVSGDRDTFQLTSDNIKVRIPHTKVGKTEVDTYDKAGVIEKYGVTPKQLIEVKGLMGDTSDNIPGVPGVGEKTALELVKKYKSIENLYDKIEKEETDLKPKLIERLVQNKNLAELSRTLGTINLEVPIEETIESLQIKEWNKSEVLAKFKELNFNRFIERFDLHDEEEAKDINDLFEIKELKLEEEINDLLNKIKENKKLCYYFEKINEKQMETKMQNEEQTYYKEQNEEQVEVANKLKTAKLQIINKQIKAIYVYFSNVVYEIKFENTLEKIQTEQEDNLKNLQTENNLIKWFKNIFEDENIKKTGYHLSEDYVLLKQVGINLKGIYFDAKIAAYDLNPSTNQYELEKLIEQYLKLNISQYLETDENKKEKELQLTLFDEKEDDVNLEQRKNAIFAYSISNLETTMLEKLETQGILNLFTTIEMPLIKVLAEMQVVGIYADKEELILFGNKLKEEIESLTQEIYKLSGEEFNINSPQQLGIILFEKLKLPVYKKTKKGYSTDVDILEKLRGEHPVIEKILDYRSLVKLNSTYIEGLINYINKTTNKIHSYFHQTITATGRISSTEPNLQNIPTRIELGKQIRKAFKPGEGNIFIDADYSQIELRILAHISGDKNMQKAFLNNEDIHKQVASKVFDVPLNEVTKEQRTAAKAVNFGIVYGISAFGLAEQLKIGRKEADSYIKQYMEKYKGVKKFMDEIVKKAKEQGYVETLFSRRRYIPELASNNYLVRQFGARAAMNTPIQGTAADIMKIAMIKVFEKLEEENLNAKIVLQIHDELLIECKIEEKEKVKQILKDCMENAKKLDVPLVVEMSEAYSWYDVK